MQKRIYVLLDYLNAIYSVVDSHYGLDKDKFKKYFEDKGYEVMYKKLYQIDFRRENYKNQYIIYQSAEIPDLKYKGFIEDILLGLLEQGAILIPEFKYFRAHHNKVFEEILRDLSECDLIKNISSKYYGTFEEYKEDLNTNLSDDNVVFKLSEGSGSNTVRLLKNNKDKIEIPKKFSEIKIYRQLKRQLKRTMMKPYRTIKKKIFPHRYKKSPLSVHRNKFIIQSFAKNLSGDYKVLVFGDKYYVLRRKNRPKDFRASGSGRFSYPENSPEKLLDFSQKVFNSFNVPFISMDIGFEGEQCYLIEFQFVMFGTYTLEESPYCCIYKHNNWEIIREKSDLEREYANSIIKYIQKIKKL